MSATYVPVALVAFKIVSSAILTLTSYLFFNATDNVEALIFAIDKITLSLLTPLYWKLIYLVSLPLFTATQYVEPLFNVTAVLANEALVNV